MVEKLVVGLAVSKAVQWAVWKVDLLVSNMVALLVVLKELWKVDQWEPLKAALLGILQVFGLAGQSVVEMVVLLVER